MLSKGFKLEFYIDITSRFLITIEIQPALAIAEA